MLTVVAVAVIVLVAALVQGAVGYGFGLLAAPLLVLVEPALVPVPTILAAFTLGLLGVAGDRGSVDWSGVGWALLGRVPGTALGVAAVTLLPGPAFTVVVALSVLLGVVLSVSAWSPRPTRVALVVAGVVSGTVGTASSIGGPPVALLYQSSPGPEVRATMAAFFVVGSLMSLVGLGVAGGVDGEALRLSAAILPLVVTGWVVSRWVRHRLDQGWTRPAVLSVAAVAAVLLLGSVVL